MPQVSSGDALMADKIEIEIPRFRANINGLEFTFAGQEVRVDMGSLYGPKVEIVVIGVPVR